jgi:hypothetical protein
MGPLTSDQNEMFLRNPRFLGLKFPDMTRPETLEKRYSGIMAKKELSFMKVSISELFSGYKMHTLMQGLLRMDPAERLTGSSALEHPYVQTDFRSRIKNCNTRVKILRGSTRKRQGPPRPDHPQQQRR